MRRLALFLTTFVSLIGCSVLSDAPIAPGPKTQVDQGPGWGLSTRAKFYSTDQGAQIMPLRWMKALKQPDGTPFLADGLSRYGYLTNNEDPASILPVGFTDASYNGVVYAGMTCSACHTREITVAGKAYRIDGGPAIADFQTFLSDIDKAMRKVLANDAAFRAFAQEAQDPPASAEALKAEVKLWYKRFGTLIAGALPREDKKEAVWGPSRLDAVAMIFNRLAGLDLGLTPDHIIKGNIVRADAPVRYPFLWNAPIQDLTQWPGFAPNGDNILGLVRNLGEVYGVFATFHPIKDPAALLQMNYRPKGGNPLVDGNSANFKGLELLERLVRQIGPPKYQWPIDQALAARGKTVFEAKAGGEPSCNDCHGVFKGTPRFLNPNTWKTPVMDVGTDTREANLMKAVVPDTGIMQGAFLPGSPPLGKSAPSAQLLLTAVAGTILDKIFPPPAAPAELADELRVTVQSPASLAALSQTGEAAELTSAASQGAAPAQGAKYESRVMQGIWAAAPYMHNGSVPTLTDLLKPVAERPESFKIGPEYDPAAVGLAREQTKFNFTLHTTGCDNLNSGNSRCGHEFGTNLSPEDKRALLEYLKSL